MSMLWLVGRLEVRQYTATNFSVEHVLRGGFPSIRHNEIMDITADLLTEICHDVSVEPVLTELPIYRMVPDLMSP